jgi:hypothetical protein
VFPFWLADSQLKLEAAYYEHVRAIALALAVVGRETIEENLAVLELNLSEMLERAGYLKEILSFSNVCDSSVLRF